MDESIYWWIWKCIVDWEVSSAPQDSWWNLPWSVVGSNPTERMTMELLPSPGGHRAGGLCTTTLHRLRSLGRLMTGNKKIRVGGFRARGSSSRGGGPDRRAHPQSSEWSPVTSERKGEIEGHKTSATGSLCAFGQISSPLWASVSRLVKQELGGL